MAVAVAVIGITAVAVEAAQEELVAQMVVVEADRAIFYIMVEPQLALLIILAVAVAGLFTAQPMERVLRNGVEVLAV